MPEEHTLHNTRKTCCSGTPTSQSNISVISKNKLIHSYCFCTAWQTVKIQVLRDIHLFIVTFNVGVGYCTFLIMIFFCISPALCVSSFSEIHWTKNYKLKMSFWHIWIQVNINWVQKLNRKPVLHNLSYRAHITWLRLTYTNILRFLTMRAFHRVTVLFQITTTGKCQVFSYAKTATYSFMSKHVHYILRNVNKWCQRQS